MDDYRDVDRIKVAHHIVQKVEGQVLSDSQVIQVILNAEEIYAFATFRIARQQMYRKTACYLFIGRVFVPRFWQICVVLIRKILYNHY